MRSRSRTPANPSTRSQSSKRLIAIRPTPERLGLLGGRYKRLYGENGNANANSRSICARASTPMNAAWSSISTNITAPATCRASTASGSERRDELRAHPSRQVVVAACERARRRKVADEWLNATLLGAAFDAHDCDKADDLAAEVASEGAANWQIESTLGRPEALAFHRLKTRTPVTVCRRRSKRSR